ncbi:MAG: hypothetical protein Q7T20_13265 [Saprospiraceae bacterium]|nr:hypothetical protein [Saprospiraceae bacterium]
MRNITSLAAPTSLSPPWVRPEQNLVRSLRETESTQQLSCDVVFGSPSADCMGTGVCRISARSVKSPALPEHKRSCRSTVGLLFPIEGGRGVSLVLTKAILCTQLYKKHLRAGTISLESPCPLPQRVTKTLGLTIRELPIGVYTIQKGDGLLRIDFLEAKI